jgi:hypothetical protein
MTNELREGLHELMRRLAEGRSRRECLEALGDFRDLTSRELAHLEQVSVRTLEDWAERGDGPPLPQGRPQDLSAPIPPRRLSRLAREDDHDQDDREAQKCGLILYEFCTTPLFRAIFEPLRK